MAAPLAFLDTETTGIGPFDDVWEVAVIRRDVSGVETMMHTFVQHDLRKARDLPERFRKDHRERYDPNLALSHDGLFESLADMLRPDDHTGNRCHIVGAVPDFDTFHLVKLWRARGLSSGPWHYHLIDVENLAVGYAYGAERSVAFPLTPPWESDDLSRHVGVEPDQWDRHTALGDALWAKAIYDRVTGYRSPQQGSPEGGELHA